MGAPTVVNTVSASYLEDNTTGTTSFTFGGSTHTSSGGADRCLVAVVYIRSSVGTTSRTIDAFTWNGVSMLPAARNVNIDPGGGGNPIRLHFFVLNDPAADTAGAIAMTTSGNCSGTCLWFLNVEGCPSGAEDAGGTASDVTGTSADVSVTVAPTVANTLCILAFFNDLLGLSTFTAPITEDDDRSHGGSQFTVAVGHGTLGSSGSQAVGATIAAADEWAAAAICLEGTADSGSVGAGLTNGVLLERRRLAA